MTSPAPPQTVTYWAISILNSKTFWFGVGTSVVGLLSDPDIRVVLPQMFAALGIPLAYLPRVVTVIGIVIVILRKLTKRPVVLSAPFTTQPVDVPKIGPPPPATLSD